MNLAWATRGAASSYRARRQMELRGVTPNGYRIWDGQETGDLIANVSCYPLAMLKLPRRTLPAARAKASRLRITRPKAREWDENEIPRLRKIYPTGTRAEIEAAFPGRSYSAIARAANARGIYRKLKPYKPSGNPLVDQILIRARSEGWTLSQLDMEIRSGGFFSKRKWTGKQNVRFIMMAAKLLGGQVRARFPTLEREV